MDRKTKLWEEMWELSLREICCASPGLYGILTEVFREKKEAQASGTDGEIFYYHLDAFFEFYKKEGVKGLNRFLLHALFHVLYFHGMDREAEQEKNMQLWNLACDIVTEYTIDCLNLKELTGTMKQDGQALCKELWKGQKSLCAEEVYRRLLEKNPDADMRKQWESVFARDCHSFWKSMECSKTERLLEKIGSFSAFSQGRGTGGRGKAGTEAGNQQEWYELQAKRKRDYHKFLRRFTVEREELQIDTESFDYIPYLYGLSQYGNLPIIEPLEYTETRKLQELVIAIDTSSSCTREIVQRFLEETYGVLSRQEDFFKKINVHIIQCDCYIQEDVKVTCEREWKNYLKHIRIQGRGGTDFRPVFRYVEELKQRGELDNLKGLLYFTDGDGIYPTEKPDYETAFLLTKEPPKEANTPLWAKFLYMDERYQREEFL